MKMKTQKPYNKLEQIVEKLKERGVRAEICRRVVQVTESVNNQSNSHSQHAFNR
ncbi:MULTISPECIES: hypothetical protein [Priestia]|jgi:predicted peroxiredoxin|nr:MULTISPECIES: hypothetical protein [Priestia]MBY6087645.1 hypothetical protein [Priestia flexa]